MEAPFLNNKFWSNSDSLVLLNPKLSSPEAERLKAAALRAPLSDVIWLQSSGTESHRSGAVKLVALPKKGILAAAASVAEFFKVSAQDCWLQPLPKFHIGGLSVYARAHVSGCRVEEMGFPQKWSPTFFHQKAEACGATIVSLVPTQVYDLVKNKTHAPKSLRLAIVGGGAMSRELMTDARQLGWPVLASYGMTETAALMASMPMSALTDDGPNSDLMMEVLPHIKAELNEEGKLLLRGKSMAEGVLFVTEDKEEFQPLAQPFESDDRVRLEGGRIEVLSRDSEFVKILGESVNLVELALKLKKTFPDCSDAIILPVKDERRGFRLVGFIEGTGLKGGKEVFNKDVWPFENLEQLTVVESFSRTPLGKIKKSDLHAFITHCG